MSQDEERHHPLITSFLSKISEPSIRAKQELDFPDYWTSNPSSLLTTANIHSVSLGTGNRILESLLPALENAESEVLFVTCYWAQSDSLNRIADSLRKLSARNLASPKNDKTRVRICFSSSGVWQKLSHPQTRQGRTYAPSEWTKTLGLPGPEELQGIDLQVKSIFFLPSCNVSWEAWFEGCVELSGGVVGQLVEFWEDFWEDFGRGVESTIDGSGSPVRLPSSSSSPSPALLTHLSHSQLPETQTKTLFLPSPHHWNPQFHPFPLQSHPDPPPTPLNTFLLLAFTSARRSIRIQTPNLTSQPAIEALLGALARGVQVKITTSEDLQRMEQVVTAGTTTGRCVAQLVQRHGVLVEERRRAREQDVEEGMGRVGQLSISYYQPSQSRLQVQDGDTQEAGVQADEPVQSHFKLTIIDGQVAVFGSGNLDRASWFTSQELGVAFFGREFVGSVEEGLERAMRGRRKVFFEG
jgi:phosphatidylserine/phosphatidylglycerophosphate/cardiolipin synthase-like enzyme